MTTKPAWKLYKDGTFHGIFDALDPLEYMRHFAKNRFDQQGFSMEGQTKEGYFYNVNNLHLTCEVIP